MSFNVNRRHNATGRSTSRAANSRQAKRLGPPEGKPWIWLTREMIGSKGFRDLSRAASLTLFRMMFEHMAHAGTENGNLVVTYMNLENWGVRRTSISNALQELQDAGFIQVMIKGGRSYGNARQPSRYRLTWLPTHDNDPPTNEWKAMEKRNSPGTESCLSPDTKTSRKKTSLIKRERQ